MTSDGVLFSIIAIISVFSQISIILQNVWAEFLNLKMICYIRYGGDCMFCSIHYGGGRMICYIHYGGNNMILNLISLIILCHVLFSLYN